jgi:hypothetical protein
MLRSARRHRPRADGDDTVRILAARRRAAAVGRGVYYRGRQARAIARGPACRRRRSGWTRTGGAPGQPRDADLHHALLTTGVIQPADGGHCGPSCGLTPMSCAQRFSSLPPGLSPSRRLPRLLQPLPRPVLVRHAHAAGQLGLADIQRGDPLDNLFPVFRLLQHLATSSQLTGRNRRLDGGAWRWRRIESSNGRLPEL